MNELLLLARVAGERVAFRAADVQSVVEIGEITAAPLTPPFVAGLAALRSRPLTVIDTGLSLGLASARGGATGAVHKAVVVEQDRHLYALLVEGIDDVVAAESDIAPPPGRLDEGWERVSLGLVETADGAVLLVDPAVLVAGPGIDEAA